MELISILGMAVGIPKEIGILDKLKDRLQTRSSDPAFRQISKALNSMILFYNVMDVELERLTKLSLASEVAIENSKNYLLRHVRSGKLYSHLRKGRLKCGDIKAIWEKGHKIKKVPPLKDWFLGLKNDGLINQDDYNKVKELFDDVSNSDGDLVQLVEKINIYANFEANKILHLLEAPDIKNAEIEVKKLVSQVDDFRIQLSSYSGQLQILGNEFMITNEVYAPQKNQSIWHRVVMAIRKLKRK